MEHSSQIGRWSLRFDPQLTADLYRQASAIACECVDCVNFRAAGERAFSQEFLQLLRQIGIDPLKPAELCHYGSSGEPMPTQGWFHFVGQLASGEDAWLKTGDETYTFDPEPFAGMKSIGFSSRLALVPEPFAGQPLVQLEFETVVPWVASLPTR